MNPTTDADALERRVKRAAEHALADHKYVSAIDVLTGMGLLAPSNVEAWRKGRVDSLESVIQGSLEKISRSMSLFRKWALAQGLRPSETDYVRRTRDGTAPLQFSRNGAPDNERDYRTHFVSPDLSERRREQLNQKLRSAPDIVVFWTLRDSACSECGTAIEQDGFLTMDADQPLCLACARLDDLEFLEAGDAAMSRRAKKYSARSAVVVRFSRSRKRYERQGILAEVPAIERAEQECAQDADVRATTRQRDAARRVEEDRELVKHIAERIRTNFPGCPPAEARAIAEHTATRGSGRVGRSAAGRSVDDVAIELAVTAAIRHRHTPYDELLATGLPRGDARERVADQVQRTLADWQR